MATGGEPRVVAWEVTRRCPLACKHCRAGAQDCAYEGELTTAECLRVLDSLAGFGRPMIIWTGGEPMYQRPPDRRFDHHAPEKRQEAAMLLDPDARLGDDGAYRVSAG